MILQMNACIGFIYLLHYIISKKEFELCHNKWNEKEILHNLITVHVLVSSIASHIDLYMLHIHIHTSWTPITISIIYIICLDIVEIQVIN